MTLNKQDNPEQLYPPDILQAGDPERPWRIAKVKSRREKALARYLAGEGIGYHLPMVYRQQSAKRGKRYSLIPVFSGYLFFRASDHERYRAMCSDYIATVLETGDQLRLARELAQINRALSLETPVYPYHFLTEGQMVRIIKGPLKGTCGRVVSKGSSYRLVLSVSAILQAVTVEIDAGNVEPIPDQDRTVMGLCAPNSMN
ncbi:MAG: transcription termination/antitermination NusG family protein [Desulfovermiculus sp.]|nr:transcription termination/antitermination NusG family protein [Desulfovermiculus sp.]